MKIVTAFLCLVAASWGQNASRPVALASNTPPRSGTLLRELLHINVERGSTRIEAASGNRQMSTRWMHRYNLVRRLQGGGAEEVEVREHGCAAGNFPGTTPPPAGEARGPLSSKTLRARRRSSGLEYVMKDTKATAPEQSCLLDLGFASSLLEIIRVAIGTQPRKAGESWKPVIQNPRGNAYGLPILKDVETNFGSVEERPDGPHAHLFISGSFTMQRPMGFNAAIEVSFAVTLTRRLTDMLDVETKITGIFKNTYAAGYIASQNAKPERATFIQELPYVLTRTLKIEGK
ncbi:MAG: hypothetical protein JNG86_12085 [Verrucomicrobiaceae bacterium]|nr:hypothetical protein [Verrucomicrobiaceae bacterium]